MDKLAGIINNEQWPNGSFPSWSAPMGKWQKGKITATSFFTSLILSALLPTLKNEEMKMANFAKACHFLSFQKSQNFTWNYWQKNSPESSQFPVPDDLDDTFCAAQALFLNNPQRIPASRIARLIKLLTSQETHAGGPYKTWIVPPNFSKHWQDVDLAINCNIAYFLSFFDVQLENLNKIFEKAIAQKTYTSPYYATPYPVLYFLSRAYKGSKTGQMIKFIISKRNQGKWKNPQDTALAVSALLNLGAPIKEAKKAVAYLTALKPQEITAFPFCMDPQQGGKKYAAGSKSLTAALILEALVKYKKARKLKNKAEEKFYISIAEKIHKDARTLTQPLRKEAFYWISKVLDSDKNHKIVLTTYWSCSGISKITQLASLATFYGWMVYLLQDQMLDGDAGPELIPIANYFQTQLNSIIVNLELKGIKAHQLLNKLCRTMDGANLFELNNLQLRVPTREPIVLTKLPTRYLNHKLLAAKSAGFAFGPLLMSKNSGKFFHHYLIARQLNDDAHDWEKDLEKGRLNSVSTVLIAKWQRLYPNKRLTLAKAVNELRPVFWNSVIANIIRQINTHCKKAIIQNKKMLPLVAPLQNAAKQAMEQQRQAHALLKIFRQNKTG
jgi:hypothetical protein